MSAPRSALFGLDRDLQGAGDAPPTQAVSRFCVHEAPLDFRELCLRAVSPRTRVLVIDLDRTIHLGRNMGELLGWEIVAHLGYGPAYLDELEPLRGVGRLFLAPKRPLATVRYLGIGASLWASPGLFYFWWGKLAFHRASLRRRAFRRFGPEPVRAVQRVPQHALLHQIAALPSATVRELADRLLARHAAEQTIDAADIAWLRARCPDVRVVISSASPRPIAEAAGALLGVDAVVCTELDETEERAAAPCDLSPRGRPRGAPLRISRQSRQRINAGPAKLAALLARFPELADPDVESVGVTDTGYGEDHSWTELLGTVVDVNSDAPFSPVVARGARARAIHSASLLTRRERDARARGEAWLDPRRHAAARVACDLSRREIEARLGPLADELDSLARALEGCEAELSSAREAARRALVGLEPAIDSAVDDYNAASPERRPAMLAELRRVLDERAALEARIVRIERPLSERAYALVVALERARAKALEPDLAALAPPRLASAKG